MKNFTNPKSQGRIDLIEYAKTNSCKNRIGDVLNSINEKKTATEAKDRLKAILKNLVKHDIVRVVYGDKKIDLDKPASDYRSEEQKDWPEELGVDAVIKNYYWSQEIGEIANYLMDQEHLVPGENLYSVFNRNSSDPIGAMNKLLKEAAHNILTKEQEEKNKAFEDNLDI